MWKNVRWLTLGLAATIAAALAYGSNRWQAETDQMHADLEGARRPIAPNRYRADELVGLPAPVQRYFRAALTDGQPMVAAVTLEHTGTFTMSLTDAQWKPFRSTQRVVTQRPGFDWEARIAIMPGMPARVHDAYIGGEGMLHASLFGLVMVADQRGTPEMAQGELLRWFAEAAWYPTALLPSQGVTWEAVDDSSARATMQDGDTTVTLLFRFNADGLIDSLRAEARGALIDGVSVPTPWEGRWSRYELRDGMRVPIAGEVAWMLPAGPWPYWRGRITSIAYAFAP
ncbi:hypothetical protein K2Z83_23035 [Oscillochloris sp. ZM17-4]|uniref:DUF6920 family protein n=1 Tax=Oscillochloris sp. ZM17-4 TaxID=2866714 RepID=UPI001C730D33|nr:DUF6544 family protein [Oscillochloris sp. ZM17-4]MBX0330535.1 hypothetical protein [Oscillochloris sp. ZM17-4]